MPRLPDKRGNTTRLPSSVNTSLLDRPPVDINRRLRRNTPMEERHTSVLPRGVTSTTSAAETDPTWSQPGYLSPSASFFSQSNPIFSSEHQQSRRPYVFPPSIPAYVSPEGNLSQVPLPSTTSLPPPPSHHPSNVGFLYLRYPIPPATEERQIFQPPAIDPLHCETHGSAASTLPPVTQPPIADESKQPKPKPLGRRKNEETPVVPALGDNAEGHTMMSCTYKDCPFKSYRRRNYNCHLRYHKDMESGDGSRRYYHCREPDCGYIATDTSNLQVHSRMHKGIKPFACEVPGCGYSSTQRNNVRIHFRRHHRHDADDTTTGDGSSMPLEPLTSVAPTTSSGGGDTSVEPQIGDDDSRTQVG